MLGYEAAFGPLGAVQKQAGLEQSAEDRLAELASSAGRISLQDLWDAPSHVLPPPSVLAGPSLEAMLAALAH